MITVKLPDGTELRFPDGTSQDVMRNAIQSLAAREAQAGLMGQNTTDTAAPQGGVSVDQANLTTLGEGVTGAIVGARNGMSMGLIDNLKGAVIGGLGGGVAQPDGSIDMFNYGTPMGERYAGVRDQVRAENATAREAAPGPYMAGNIGGGVAASMTALPTIPAKTIVGMGAGLATMGAVEGGLLGFGNSDGQNTASNTMWGALLGAPMGILAPLAVGATRMAGRPVGGLFDYLTGRASPGRAGVALDRVVQRSGMDIGDIDASIKSAFADGQNEFRIADALGNPGQRALSGVARAPGDGRTAIVDFLRQRQAGQQDRVGGFLSDALDTPDTAAIRQLQREAERGADASANYGAARDAATPVDIRPALDVIEGRLGPLRDSGIAGAPIDNLLRQYEARLTVPSARLPDGVDSMELSDFSRVFEIKKDLHDDIQAAIRAGRGNEAGMLRSLQSALDDALAAASDPYAAARDTYRTQSQAIDAIQTGREAARPGRTQDAVDAYSRLAPQAPAPVAGLLSPPSNPGNLPATVPAIPTRAAAAAMPDTRQAGFRAGYVDPIMARIENMRPTNNAAGALTTPKNQEMLARMADDPALLLRRIDRENTMFQTGFEALGGSKTADNLADSVDMEGVDLGLLANIFQGRWAAAAAQVAQKGANAAKGMNEETRALIAQALLSNDPQAALAPLMRRALLTNRTASAAEAAIRQSAFQGLLAP